MATGCTLTPTIPPSASAGNGPAFLAYSPLTRDNMLLAAIPNYNSNTISVYTVSQQTGVFTNQVAETFIPGDPGAMPATIAFTPPLPTGNIFAVATNNDSPDVNAAFAIYTVAPQLTAGHYFSSTTVVPTNIYFNTPIDAEFSPLVNGHLYVGVANTGSTLTGIDHEPVRIIGPLSNTISIFEMNQNTGQVMTVLPPSPLSTNEVANGLGVRSVAFSPVLPGNKVLAAVTNEGVLRSNGSVAVFIVDANTGTFDATTPATFAAGINPIGVAFFPPPSASLSSSNGNLYAAVTNSDQFSVDSPGSSVWVYRVNITNGVFTFLQTYTLTGLNPNVITFSPLLCTNEVFGLVSNFGEPTTHAGQGLTLYQANIVTGVLTLIPQLFPVTGGLPDGVAFSPLLHSSQKTLLFAAAANFGTNGANGVNTYQVMLPATITLVATPTIIVAGETTTLNGIISSGTPPFLLQWSDGTMQVTYSLFFSRTVTPTVTTKYQVLRANMFNNLHGCSTCPSNLVTIITMMKIRCCHDKSKLRCRKKMSKYMIIIG